MGIDTPELKEENNNINEYLNVTDMSCLKDFGIAAKTFVETIVNQTDCCIIFDEQAGFKDPYQRWLCYIFLDNDTDLNSQLLKKGFARAYTSETFEKKEYYINLQNKAIDERIGLWGCS